MKKILVIDDDQDITAAIEYIIRSIDPLYVCTSINDPYEALLKLADEEFDLVLVDQKIPGLFGSDILKKIDQFIDIDTEVNRLGLYKKPVSVVLMSGDENIKELKLKLEHFNVTDYVVKKDLTSYLKNRLGSVQVQA